MNRPALLAGTAGVAIGLAAGLAGPRLLDRPPPITGEAEIVSGDTLRVDGKAIKIANVYVPENFGMPASVLGGSRVTCHPTGERTIGGRIIARCFREADDADLATLMQAVDEHALMRGQTDKWAFRDKAEADAWLAPEAVERRQLAADDKLRPTCPDSPDSWTPCGQLRRRDADRETARQANEPAQIADDDKLRPQCASAGQKAGTTFSKAENDRFLACKMLEIRDDARKTGAR